MLKWRMLGLRNFEDRKVSSFEAYYENYAVKKEVEIPILSDGSYGKTNMYYSVVGTQKKFDDFTKLTEYLDALEDIRMMKEGI